jgi:hypothetical protein
MLYPLTLDVLGFQESATLGGEDCVPSPVSDCVTDESAALLRNEMLPEETPDAGGVKVTV